MAKATTFTLKVIFGEQASAYAAEHGYAKTKKKIDAGKLDGYNGE